MNYRDEFDAAYPGWSEKISEKVFDKVEHDINILEHYYNNRIESYGLVSFFIGEQEVMVAFRSGDFNGFEVLDYGMEAQLPPRTWPVYKWIPTEGLRPNEKSAVIQMLLRNKTMFDEELRKMAYDYHFEPTDKIRQHYKLFMAKWKLSYEVEYKVADEI